VPDKLKSSYDLAMERLRKQDAERGEKPASLGKKEREDIAEIRRVYQAKTAEREILYQAERRKAAAAAAEDPSNEVLQKVEEVHRRERERLEEERDSKIEAVRRRSRGER
jgi:hypothetical protein